jgi:dienelactone hydrolase
MQRILIILVGFSLVVGVVGMAAGEPKIKGVVVEYSAQGMVMNGYLAYDENITGRRPGVLVVHEWWRLNNYARQRALMLAELGYAALALDMNMDLAATHPADAQAFSSELIKNYYFAKERFMRGMKFLQEQPVVDPNRIAAIGYCLGGGIVVNMARYGVDLKGVASFHGGLTSAQQPAQRGDVKARVLVLHGGDDQFTTPEQIEEFKAEMEAAGADYRFISYPGALHGFTNPDANSLAKEFNLQIGYNAEADRESWKELKKFLKKVFGE